MTSVLYQLARPFAFGGIKHEQLQGTLVWFPLAVAAVAGVGWFLLPVRPHLTGPGSLSSSFLTVFAILPGFYIAALAAVATFDRESMDFIMPPPTPRLTLRTGPYSSEVEVTFRMFLSVMFSYLTAMSFLAVFVFVGADLLAPSLAFAVDAMNGRQWNTEWVVALKAAYVFSAVWLAAKIVITTLLGLYFLAERIHRPSA